MSASLLIIVYALAAIAALIALMYSAPAIRGELARRGLEDAAGLRPYLIEKLSAALFLGLIPFGLFVLPAPAWPSWLSMGNAAWSWAYILVFSGLILLINAFRAGKPDNYARYPQVRARVWMPGLLAVYLGGWVLYLTAYEFLFRGLLLYASLEWMPLWAAAGLNSVLYAIAHLAKGRQEIIASLPFGILLCLITWHSGSFWPAALIHMALACSNSMFAIRGNPEMRFIWQ
jgi:membrane protease YdiL (CAAX protease family)